MRIALTLQPVRSNQLLSYNYQYQISGLLYKILWDSSKKYATILHQHGLRWENKDYKLFSYSHLQFEHYRPTKRGLTINGLVKLVVASPMDKFVRHLVEGVFQQGEIRIGEALFQPRELQILKPPQFDTNMTGLCRSPLVVSTVHRVNGSLKPYYYRATDPEIGEAVESNLLRKYAAFTKKSLESDSIKFQFDQDYLGRKSPKEVSKLITIKEGSEEATQIKGIVAPFQLAGNPEIIEFAWHAGLGERTSQGFGFWDAIKTNEE